MNYIVSINVLYNKKSYKYLHRVDGGQVSKGNLRKRSPAVADVIKTDNISEPPFTRAVRNKLQTKRYE